MAAWDADVVRSFVERDGLSQEDALVQLNQVYQTTYSERTIRRFCKEHDIRRHVSNEELDRLVAMSIGQVGPRYGRKMMKGELDYE